MLLGVTHVMVDEIHERGMIEDFLLILMREVLPRRPDLRLVLMSATFNSKQFSSYFGDAPMMNIPVCTIKSALTASAFVFESPFSLIPCNM
jgi:ATP-dependent RNA helicase DHX36